MLNGQKIVVVMPAYNAARTLRQTYDEVMAHGIVDLVIVVDDASQDETVAVARTLDRVQVEVHPVNRGYGANQKTCYRLALAAGGNIIIMIHRGNTSQTGCSLSWKTFSSVRSSQSIILDIAPFRASCCNDSRWKRIPMTLFSTIRFLRRSSHLAVKSAK